MADLRNTDFIRDDILPSYWANAIQQFLSGLAATFRVERQSATTVRVPAVDGRSAIAVDGKWRWRDTDVSRVVAGAAGAYDVFIVALDEDVTNVPDPFTDNSDRSFDLRIVAAGGTPAVAPADPAVEIFEGPVATLTWDGAAITAFEQTRKAVAGAQLGDDVLTTANGLTATRQPGGGFLLDLAAASVPGSKLADDAVDTRVLAPLAVTNAEVAAAAAIAESKLNLASDAAAGTASRRTLGAGATQAAPGNDARFPAGADIVNADIAAAAAIAESKLALASDAAAGTASRRTLGTNAGQAMAGNQAAGGVLAGTYPNPAFAADMATQAELDAKAADYEAAFSTWKPVGVERSIVLLDGLPASNYVMSPEGSFAVAVNNINARARWGFPLDDDVLDAGARAVQMRIVGFYATNVVAPGTAFGVELRPVSDIGGGSAAEPYISVIGALAGDASVAAPAADALLPFTGAAFTAPAAAGVYMLNLVNSGALATNSRLHVLARLEYRQQ